MTEQEAIRIGNEYLAQSMIGGTDEEENEYQEFLCKAIETLKNQAKLQEAIPEMTREHNLCMEIIDEYSLTKHTLLECKAFNLCGAVMQTLGAMMDLLEVEE